MRQNVTAKDYTVLILIKWRITHSTSDRYFMNTLKVKKGWFMSSTYASVLLLLLMRKCTKIHIELQSSSHLYLRNMSERPDPLEHCIFKQYNCSESPKLHEKEQKLWNIANMEKCVFMCMQTHASTLLSCTIINN